MSNAYQNYSDKEIRILLAPLAARLIPDVLTKQIDDSSYLTMLGMYETHLDELCKFFKQTHGMAD